MTACSCELMVISFRSTPTPRSTSKKPLASIANLTANVWIGYHVKSRSDGVLLADSAAFIPNTISDKEAHLLDKTDYDPAAVDPNSKQNIAREIILGRDPKKIPPYKDAALQARVDRIGTSLIPGYQKKLPESDLTKVIFRFQLIDDPEMKDALALPSGVILIPFQIVNKLKNDSQLATFLADNIATVLEKQHYRLLPAMHAMTAANLASLAAGVVVPGIASTSAVGASSIGTSVATKSIQTDLLNQSGRVSLGLLHDAGYDINQAPMTWWLLAANAADKLPSTPLPLRAANLYKSIGSTWRNYPEASGSQSTLKTK
jgi:predicted Zn-dependent protease